MSTINRILSTIALSITLVMFALPSVAAVFVKFDTIEGESEGPGGEPGWVRGDRFSFGVEREMKESGEKGGTQDINIGIGELQECTLSKSMDSASPSLAQAAINGKTIGSCEVCLAEEPSDREAPVCYAHFVMERCYVKSWSTAGDADDRPTEDVAFYYNKIAFGYMGRENNMNWDQERNRLWPEGVDWLFDYRSPPR